MTMAAARSPSHSPKTRSFSTRMASTRSTLTYVAADKAAIITVPSLQTRAPFRLA